MSKIKNKPELDLYYGTKNIFLLNKDKEHFKLESEDVYFSFNNDLEVSWDYMIYEGSSKLNMSINLSDQKVKGSFEIENEEDMEKLDLLSELNGTFDYEVELVDMKKEITMNPFSDDFHLHSLEAKIKEIRQIDQYNFRVIFERVEAKF